MENFDEAINCPVHQIHIDKNGKRPTYPLGEIRLKCGESIHIHFMHYDNFDEALRIWQERCRRINRDNLFVLMELGFNTNAEYVRRFDSLPFKNKAVMTASGFEEVKSAIPMEIYDPKCGYKMIRRIPGTIKKYVDLFDYVHWFNTGKIRHSRSYEKHKNI